jgi:uncharacterized membrane protein
MNVKLNQNSTQRGLILTLGAIVSLVFTWFGHDAAPVAPIVTVLIAGLHGAVTNDEGIK